ncbi:hypothetical protein BDV25DRAFT_119333 [Aspergillus avenaceus]|uniref:Uncharacterized protein n=1 Tax=Aspergillus avenaceus TaxID=36643 RepID=A0A5N6TCY2_ASPAV|nr:hypothetical protein BDV25DRAFT_119333 [Aspergillus avenaceus]
MGSGRFLGLAWHYIDLVHIFPLLFLFSLFFPLLSIASIVSIFPPLRSFSFYQPLYHYSLLFFSYLSFYLDHFLTFFFYLGLFHFSYHFLLYFSRLLCRTLLLHDPSKSKSLATSYQNSPQPRHHCC